MTVANLSPELRVELLKLAEGLVPEDLSGDVVDAVSAVAERLEAWVLRDVPPVVVVRTKKPALRDVEIELVAASPAGKHPRMAPQVATTEEGEDSDDAKIAEHIASKGVTKVPPARVAPTIDGGLTAKPHSSSLGRVPT